MSISASEFVRSLRRFAGRAPLEERAPGTWRLESAEGPAVISARAIPPLRIAALSLPRHVVRIDLSAMPEEGRAAFLARFELSFHRGGG